ncbi:MAG TPA: hypothetical protein VK800_12765 [Steroidobacteraceae bacterium]|jgi:hypothetical protein|nr:hypothetical protein [Steroidobacteraceae bacterium]
MITRTATQGPELDVVRAFLERGIGKGPPDAQVLVFCEPLLETGYPDVVVVHWQRSRAEAWPAARAEITPDDVKLLHFLMGARCVSRDELGQGISPGRRARSLDRLAAADVVTISRRWIRCRPLREIFAVSRIIALEAKISDWRRGLHQAFLNTWFASESFLLLPHLPERSQVMAEAQRIGVGVVVATERLAAPHVASRKDRLPQSYASWLFNEWAWRGFGTQIA